MMDDLALEAAEKLQGEGVSVEAVDLRTISLWDQETVLASPVPFSGRLESAYAPGLFSIVQTGRELVGAAAETIS